MGFRTGILAANDLFLSYGHLRYGNVRDEPSRHICLFMVALYCSGLQARCSEYNESPVYLVMCELKGVSCIRRVEAKLDNHCAVPCVSVHVAPAWTGALVEAGFLESLSQLWGLRACAVPFMSGRCAS